MDMSNNPTPEILRHFFAIAGIEVVILALILLVLWKTKVWKPTRLSLPTQHSRARTYFRWGLGGLWLLDGLLQLQPAMSSDFVPGVLVPLMNGQPFWYSRIMEWGVVLWASHPLLYDSFAAVIQILLGLFILFPGSKKIERVALEGSILWGLVVWILGEGLGELLVRGGADWFTGGLGSVTFYIVGAVLLLVPVERWTSGRVKHWIWKGLGGMWLFLAFLQGLPAEGFWHGSTLSAETLAMAEMAQPRIFSSPLYMAAQIMDHHAVVVNLLSTVILVIAGAGMMFKKRWALWVAMGWTFIGWWFGQDFGVLGGLGTDPNSGALVFLFVWAGILLPERVPFSVQVTEAFPKEESSNTGGTARGGVLH